MRRKSRTALAAAIVVLCLAWGVTSMLIGPPLEIAEVAYRSALAEGQRLTGVENVDAVAAAKAATLKAPEENARVEAAARKSAGTIAFTEAAAQKAAEQRLAAEEARLKAEEEARKAAEGKAKSAAAAREQPETAEAALGLSELDRKRVQVALNSLGHEMPTVTGYFGPRTRAMITAWQKKGGLPETGYLDASQLPRYRSRPSKQRGQTTRGPMCGSSPNGSKPR